MVSQFVGLSLRSKTRTKSALLDNPYLNMNAISATRVIVQLPDLFVHFLEGEPSINQHYQEVRQISERVVCRDSQLQGRIANAVAKCDFSYFGAVMAPRADRDSYRTICDWGNWIFPFDDLFDDGALREDHVRARKTMDSLLCVFDNETLTQIHEGEPLVRFHDGIWARVKATGSPGVQRRYAQAMRDYCAGALEQVRQFEVHAAPEVEAMLAMRRKSVCVSTLFALVEFGHQIALPDSVFANPVMAQIETIGIDITLMHNDLLSYRKEESDGVPHNLVAVSRMHGLSAQEAFDHIGELIKVRHQRLESTIAQLPSWGTVVNQEVLRYVEAIKDVIKANLYWSFKSGRFLSETQKAEVTTTGKLDVLAEPSYLTKKDLLATETLTHLRHQYDELGSRALDRLLKESEQKVPTQGCPLPRKDLFATLEASHDSDAEMQQLWNETMSVPSWVDWEQIERGQRFFHRYAVANIIGFALQGFIGENAAAFGPAEVLVRTGGLSARNLLQRVMETFQWLLEVTESLASIKPGGKGHTSTIRVRLLHASVRRRILQLAEARSSYFNVEEFGIPVNTYDSILTVSFFCCNPLWIQLPQLGIHPSQTELEDFVALYRYLSYLLGVPDVYFSSVGQAKATMDAMLADKKPPSDSSRKICHAFIDCLADREPFRISRSFVEAGSRTMNPEKLCDDLRLGRPGLIYYVAFTGLCWTLRSLALAQASSPHFDNKMISYFKTMLPAVIVHSKAGLGGASKFEFKYQPKLQTFSEKKPANVGTVTGSDAGLRVTRPVESVLVLIFIAFSGFGIVVGFCALKVASKFVL